MFCLSKVASSVVVKAQCKQADLSLKQRLVLYSLTAFCSPKYLNVLKPALFFAPYIHNGLQLIMRAHSVTASTLDSGHALHLWWQPSSDTGSVWRSAQWFESSQTWLELFFSFFFLFNLGLPFKTANHQSNTRVSYTETLLVKSAVSLLPLHKRPHTFQWQACP